MKTETINLYEDRNDVILTTYIQSGKKRPAILVCPGGAYLTCADSEGEPVALAFAAMGYHAFVLRYSVYGEEAFAKGLQNVESKENCQYPRPMQDIGCAMMIIKDHANEWGLDAERVVICGFSAGAHNCAMYANNWFNPVITDYFKRDAELFRPIACILGYGLSDYIFLNEENKKASQSDRMFFEASNTAFLGSANVGNDKLLEVSPARNVSNQTPPMFLWATSTDQLVPVQHTVRMAHALADAKIPFEMHVFEEGPHGLSLATHASAEALSQLYPDVAKWVGLADAWLQKRMMIELPEKTMFETLF